MTDENPTELETLQIMEEAQKKLNLAIDPEHSKFMKACITGGKSAAACSAEWNDKHKPVKMSAEMEEYTTFIDKTMKEGKTLLQSIDLWKEAHKPETEQPGISEELKKAVTPLMARLEALETVKKQEIAVQLSALVAEVKKVDPTFDDKKFTAPFGENTAGAMMAVTTYMETVKHLKETLPEVEAKLHLGTSDAVAAHRKELTKAMFGTDDMAKIVKEL